jgi:hypothetical protein
MANYEYGSWVTNCPEAANALRRADFAYERERKNAAHLPLADKVISYRCANQRRDAAYARVAKGDYT